MFQVLLDMGILMKGGLGMNTFMFIATVIGLIASVVTIEDKIERLYEKHHNDQENKK